MNTGERHREEELGDEIAVADGVHAVAGHLRKTEQSGDVLAIELDR